MHHPNIGESGARARRRMGRLALALGLVFAGWLITAAVPAWMVTLLIPPFLAAGLGYFQARYRTCVALAARGACDMGRGVERIEDAGALSAVQTQVRRVWGAAWLFALGLTAIALFLKLAV